MSHGIAIIILQKHIHDIYPNEIVFLNLIVAKEILFVCFLEKSGYTAQVDILVKLN